MKFILYICMVLYIDLSSLFNLGYELNQMCRKKLGFHLKTHSNREYGPSLPQPSDKAYS